MAESDRGSAVLARAIPGSGEAIPVVGLGTWQAFDVAGDAAAAARARDALAAFVERGGRLVDSSPMYGAAEAVVGRLAADLRVASALFVATKVWTTGRQAGIRQMDASMERLGVARLDLMQVHNLVDVDTHLETLRHWKAAGRIRYLGVTHYSASAHADLERIVARGDVDFVQVNYSLAEPEAERRLLPAAADTRTGVIVNRPFAGGAMLRHASRRRLPEWAGQLGCTGWSQLFLKWIIAHPAVTCVIPASRNPGHVADNLAAAAGPLPDEPTRRRMAELFAAL
jgi:diketogulonate reductase-like aldo/keto reductase